MGTAAAESFIASAIRGSQPEIRRNLPAAIAKAKDAVALQAQSTDLAERVGAAWWTEYFDAMENCQVSFSQRVAV
jgi:hypothetical protein